MQITGKLARIRDELITNTLKRQCYLQSKLRNGRKERTYNADSGSRVLRDSASRGGRRAALLQDGANVRAKGQHTHRGAARHARMEAARQRLHHRESEERHGIHHQVRGALAREGEDNGTHRHPLYRQGQDGNRNGNQVQQVHARQHDNTVDARRCCRGVRHIQDNS